MEEKKTIKISLSGFFLIIAIMVIVVLGVFICMQNQNAEEKIAKLEEDKASLQSTLNNLQGKTNSISQIINKNDEVLKANQDIYSAVLEEYKNAITNKNDNKYSYVNENAINHYFSQKGTEYEFNFKYAFYDINNDGKYEMLINDGAIIDIFGYDGNKIIRLFKDSANSLAEGRSSITLYDDGTILSRDSGGASHHYISFYDINKNTSTLNTINSYYLRYSEDFEVTIYDETKYDFKNDTGKKLNYKSDEELINANIHNANPLDLNKMNWHIVE